MKNYYTIVLFFLFFYGCKGQTNSYVQTKQIEEKNIVIQNNKLVTFDTSIKTIHILVALCDNKYQGIVPVPAKIGNGQDADNNLYWGCSFGIKSYFKNSKEWVFIKNEKIDSLIIERLFFKHRTKNIYLVADAYNGKYIEKCTVDFLKSSSGQTKNVVTINNTAIGINGNAHLVAYIGHDGLMDFKLTETFKNVDQKRRSVIVLACYSKNYFLPHLQYSNVNALVLTTGLMAPEAYTIHDAITGYINNETNESIKNRAAIAYAKYQKCSIKAASNLLVTQ
jgi:hypothetical protein